MAKKYATQTTQKNVYILFNQLIVLKEPSIQDQHLPKPTTPRDESLGRPKEPIGVPSTSQTLQNKTSEEAAPKPDRVTRHPIIAMDCSLTQEDKEIAQFLTFSYEDAQIVRIDDMEITVGMLCRNVTKRFIIDQVRHFHFHLHFTTTTYA